MFESFIAQLDSLFGINEENLGFLHMVARSSVIYFLGIPLSRLNKRFLGIPSVYNFILTIVLGSLLATAITTPIYFYRILGVFIFLIVLNWTMTWCAFVFPKFEIFLEGRPVKLVENGNILWPAMEKHYITEEDLAHTAHEAGGSGVKEIQTAYFESNGKITVVLKR
jgi:uncharacterized membrane protein YcaP (DUF421 family)